MALPWQMVTHCNKAILLATKGQDARPMCAFGAAGARSVFREASEDVFERL